MFFECGFYNNGLFGSSELLVKCHDNFFRSMMSKKVSYTCSCLLLSSIDHLCFGYNLFGEYVLVGRTMSHCS